MGWNIVLFLCRYRYYMSFPLNKLSLFLHFRTKEWQLLCQPLGVSLAPFSRAWSIGPSERWMIILWKKKRTCREISDNILWHYVSIKMVATHLQREAAILVNILMAGKSSTNPNHLPDYGVLSTRWGGDMLVIWFSIFHESIPAFWHENEAWHMYDQYIRQQN